MMLYLTASKYGQGIYFDNLARGYFYFTGILRGIMAESRPVCCLCGQFVSTGYQLIDGGEVYCQECCFVVSYKEDIEEEFDGVFLFSGLTEDTIAIMDSLTAEARSSV